MQIANLFALKHFVENSKLNVMICRIVQLLDWLQSLKQFFINVSYHVLVARLTLMAL